MLKIKVLKKASPDQKTIKFKEGGLHKSLNIPEGEKIPEEKIQAALSGSFGPKAKAQALFMKNVLTGNK
jgi:hypothetical protein